MNHSGGTLQGVGKFMQAEEPKKQAGVTTWIQVQSGFFSKPYIKETMPMITLRHRTNPQTIKIPRSAILLLYSI